MRRQELLGGALCLVIVAVLCLAFPGMTPARAVAGESLEREAPLQFRRDVQPILANRCYQCHGPDAEHREARLRFDRRQVVFAKRDAGHVVVPGDADSSLMMLRVTDPDYPMPPADSGVVLEAREVETLRRWIEEGAVWEEHWAYQAPVRPPVPDVPGAHHPVDAFVQARLAAAGLEPAPRADASTLLRRVTLDLTGLPPTLAELDAFEADPGAAAFADVVERLLASPRHAEHMTRDWLDLARYGDTHGLHLDNERSLWRWRDWVLEAYQENLPFDRFTVEQIAGDLLPEATLEQRIATGFQRCNPTSGEGGLIPEEYLVKYAADRVETTATVWLGTTLGCAQCHDHKFDPFSQKEYYQFFAFFSNLDEQGSDENALAPPPALAAPTPEQAVALAELETRIAAARAALDAPDAGLDAGQAAWQESAAAALAPRWHELVPLGASASDGVTLYILPDRSVLAGGSNPDRVTYEVVAQTDAARVVALVLEALPEDDAEDGPVGRSDNGNLVLSELEVEAVPHGRSGDFTRLPVKQAFADYSQHGYGVELAVDGDPGTGWAVNPRPGRNTAVFVFEEPVPGGVVLRVRLRHLSEFPRHSLARFRLSVVTDPAFLAPSTLGPWSSAGPFGAESDGEAFTTDFGPEAGVDLAAAYGPEQRWVPRPELADGVAHELQGEHCATYLWRRLDVPTARRMVLGLGSDDALKVWLDGERVLERNVARALTPDQDLLPLDLSAGSHELLLKVVNFSGGYSFQFRSAGEELTATPLPLAHALATREPAEADARLLRATYRREHSPEWRAEELAFRELEEEEAALRAEIPFTMVMAERAERRPTHVLRRGLYDQPGEEVQPGVPAILPPLPDPDAPPRLRLARWLVSTENPLTARVTVNRLWQKFFGRGLVASPEDFGTRGSFPSHPELLDWLAVEFVESEWDVRHLLRLLVTSATYQQSSAVTPELLAADPENLLLARGPRFRLDAECLRDLFLSVSGLLVEELGGPSVRPPQPEGLWEAVSYPTSNTARFRADAGDAVHRRSLYTFWKRTSPPPAMALLDAPTRESCVVSRARTNTPVQALALLNEPQCVEAARAFARRILAEGGTSDAERLDFAFRCATARRPTDREREILAEQLEAGRARYRAEPAAAAELAGQGPCSSSAAAGEELNDPAELAAWTLIANTLFNLHETLTRG